MDKFRHPALPWALTGVVSLLAVCAWGQSLAWNLGAISAYQFFPVLGLLAYSIMWSQYMAGAAHKTLLRGLDLASYFRLTGYVILAAVVLHPAILVYQLFRSGYGLPPGSYSYYVGRGMEWLALLGTASHTMPRQIGRAHV